MPRLVDLTDQPFGRLIVKKMSEKRGSRGEIYWDCECDCQPGQIRAVAGVSLREGKTLSCGCYNEEAKAQRCREKPIGKTHGMSGTRVHTIWRSMLSRCQTPSSGSYEYYGARGITVCQRWQTFENFYADMGEPPSTKHSIEREDNDGNYEPGNCRWATRREQGFNNRRTRLIALGKKTRPLTEWAEIKGLSQSTISQRLGRGWSVEDALNTPSQRAPKAG